MPVGRSRTGSWCSWCPTPSLQSFGWHDKWPGPAPRGIVAARADRTERVRRALGASAERHLSRAPGVSPLWTGTRRGSRASVMPRAPAKGPPPGAGRALRAPSRPALPCPVHFLAGTRSTPHPGVQVNGGGGHHPRLSRGVMDGLQAFAAELAGFGEGRGRAGRQSGRQGRAVGLRRCARVRPVTDGPP